MIKFTHPQNGTCPYYDVGTGRYYITNRKENGRYVYDLMYVKKGYWKKHNCLNGFKLFVRAHKMKLNNSNFGVAEYHHKGKYYFYDYYNDFLVIRFIEQTILWGYETCKDCLNASIKYLKSKEGQLSFFTE